VDFPAQAFNAGSAWLNLLQFPGNAHLQDKRILVGDELCGSGRILTVENRILSAGGMPEWRVLY